MLGFINPDLKPAPELFIDKESAHFYRFLLYTPKT